MPNTLVYAVKQCISVFLISKYNINSDFISYHDITTCHDYIDISWPHQIAVAVLITKQFFFPTIMYHITMFTPHKLLFHYQQ